MIITMYVDILNVECYLDAVSANISHNGTAVMQWQHVR